jgi:hypothetical protein
MSTLRFAHGDGLNLLPIRSAWNFLRADGGAITGREIWQLCQIATRRGFVCHRGANTSIRHELTFIVGHLTESGVD